MLVAVKSKLHYYSLLDTVHFNQAVAPKTFVSRAVNVTGLLMLDALVGNATPLLSQTQAFDNTLLLAQLAEPSEDSHAFLRLVRKGRIQVRVVGAPSLLGAFANALRQPDFVLSAWPELTDERLRSEVVRYLSGSGDDVDRLGSPSLAARLEGLRQFDNSLRQSPTMQWHAAMTRTTQLSPLITSGLRELANADPASRASAQWLLTHAPSLLPAQRERRSAWYRLLDDLPEDHSAAAVGNAKGIIDGAYNSVVANSLGATGMFAQCPTREVATALAGVDLDGAAGGQLVDIMRDEHRDEWLTWHKVDEWLDEHDRVTKPARRLDSLVSQGCVNLVELAGRRGIALKVAMSYPATGLVSGVMARGADEALAGDANGVKGGFVGGVVSLLPTLPSVRRGARDDHSQPATIEHWEFTVTTGTASWQKSVRA